MIFEIGIWSINGLYFSVIDTAVCNFADDAAIFVADC